MTERRMTSTDGAAGWERSSRDAILDAAALLMRTRGYEKTSIANLCEESGLPVGSVYHHFANKSAILAAVTERWATEFFADLPIYRQGTSDPDGQFARFWGLATDATVEQREMFALDIDFQRLSRHDPELARVQSRVRATARGALAHTFEAYAADRGVIESRVVAQRLAAVMERATRGMILGAGDDLDELRQGFVDLHLVVSATIALAAR